ncbi:retrovirus-related pol polyprotein from transposon RE1 [Tanacetum coccineum]
MIKKNNTWKLVDLLKGKNAIGVKWIYKTKFWPGGSIYKHKARLVMKGYSQVAGVDLRDTFAPVVRHDTIKLLIAIAAHRNWKIHHLYVKYAFLKGELKEEMYVKQPEVFELVGQEEKVYQLYEELYGLKQTPRACMLRLMLICYVEMLEEENKKISHHGRALARLVQSEKLLEKVCTVDGSAKDVWDNKDTRVIQLSNELRIVSQGNDSISDYFQKIQNLTDRLKNLDSKVEDKHLVSYALNGLHPKFRNMARIIRHREELPTFDNAETMLLLEESQLQQEERIDSTHGDSSSTSPTVLVSNNNSSRSQSNSSTRPSSSNNNSSASFCWNFQKGNCKFGDGSNRPSQLNAFRAQHQQALVNNTTPSIHQLLAQYIQAQQNHSWPAARPQHALAQFAPQTTTATPSPYWTGPTTAAPTGLRLPSPAQSSTGGILGLYLPVGS